jgi:hypothetical protein
MLNRRHFIIGTIGACAVANGANQPVLPAAATVNVPQPTLPASEQMMYATVRLFNETPANVAQGIPASMSWGTGFFFNLFHSPQTQEQVPVIVTNRHVIEHWNNCCHRPAYRSQGVIGILEPADDRRNEASA